MTKKPEELRSYRWFGGERTSGLRAFGHRSRMRQLGVEAEEHLGKPLIVILNTWSEINPCHMHLRQRAEQVKRGVLEAGGFPVEMPGGHAQRDVPEADPDDVPQPAGDGGRGTAPLLPGRRRGAHGRLRQDHARPC